MQTKVKKTLFNERDSITAIDCCLFRLCLDRRNAALYGNTADFNFAVLYDAGKITLPCCRNGTCIGRARGSRSGNGALSAHILVSKSNRETPDQSQKEGGVALDGERMEERVKKLEDK
jgi:hypothetical protein